MAALLRRSSCFGKPHDECCTLSELALHIDRSALLRRSDLEISAITTYERTNYPLTLVAIPGERLELRVMYDAGLFSREAAERRQRRLRCESE